MSPAVQLGIGAVGMALLLFLVLKAKVQLDGPDHSHGRDGIRADRGGLAVRLRSVSVLG
ncbi:hypothetical protein SAMN05216215_1027110 [Saccharopolyspora shandongensis]|uniref:Uncharacterized protein n=1 Tax=Saccharopolyspora shandongensis TaxID=418495 RepID=A0A1H3KAJ3_9PSEU|nr:hypothetical protein [Saccharopolyspora shandongensis]SDY48628.1 hypothetical protein SAMN05216215_1027110 [Saccharopolyspora shandongensis]